MAIDRGLTVRVVGGLVVSRAGRVLPAAEVGSRQARTVLALLAVRAGQVPMDRLASVLWWSRDPPRDPGANVATLVSRLRTALGADSVVGGRSGYRLGDRVRVDMSVATDLVADAERRIATGRPGPALDAARRADRLLGNGNLLPEHTDAPWVEPARAGHGALLRRARHAIAEAALRLGYVQVATAAAEAAVATDPFDEAACRLLMRAHYLADEPARALICYEVLRQTLASELGCDPARATRDLHIAILRELVPA